MIPGARRPGDPPLSLPLAALLAGAAAFAAAAAAALVRPDLLARAAPTPGFLALTHALTLGYVTLLFVGTLQQLLPVLLVTRLALPRLGLVTLPALAGGSAAVVAGFALGFRPLALALGGALVTLALWAAALQAVLTLVRAGRADAAARGLVTATVYLALTVTLGFLLAAAPRAPALVHAFGYPVGVHLTAGLAGAFLLGIAAAGQRLLAMFALAKRTRQGRLRLLTALVHAAMAAELLQAFARLPLGHLATALVAGAGAVQLWEVAALLRVRMRRRLEPSVRRYLWAHAFLPAAGVLALTGAGTAAAVAMLLGFVVLAVSGMQTKIVSFLAWQVRYAGRGRAGTAPLLRDLLLPGVEPLATASLVAGAVAATAATVVHAEPLALASAVLLACGAWAQLAQTVGILFGRHTTRPSTPVPAATAKENA